MVGDYLPWASLMIAPPTTHEVGIERGVQWWP